MHFSGQHGFKKGRDHAGSGVDLWAEGCRTLVSAVEVILHGLRRTLGVPERAGMVGGALSVPEADILKYAMLPGPSGWTVNAGRAIARTTADFSPSGSRVHARREAQFAFRKKYFAAASATMMAAMPTSVMLGSSLTSRMMTLRAIAIMATVRTTSKWTTFSLT